MKIKIYTLLLLFGVFAWNGCEVFERLEKEEALDEDSKDDDDSKVDDSKVILLSPTNKSSGLSPNTKLRWQTNIDNEKNIVYDVYLDTYNPPSRKVSVGKQTPSYTPTGQKNNTRYYWRVVARNSGRSISPWSISDDKDTEDIYVSSSIWSYEVGDEKVSSPNKAPTKPVLSTPTDNAKDIRPNNKLSWNPSSGIDKGDIVYDVYLGVNFPPVKLVSREQTETEYTPVGQLDNEKYYWRIVARNKNWDTDNAGWSDWQDWIDGYSGYQVSEIWSYRTTNGSSANHSPSSPSYLSPVDAATDVQADTKLQWNASTDKDGNTITYDVYLDVVNPPRILVSSNQTQTDYTPTGQGLNTRYFWQVVAKDSEGGRTVGSVQTYTTDDNKNQGSNTGKGWVRVSSSASWSKRNEHTSVVFQNKVWILGGKDNDDKNDVWYSTNGTDWSAATSSASWSARRSHTSVVYDGKLWVIGGIRNNGSWRHEFLNDVWYTADGTNWTKATDNAPWAGRGKHTSVVYDGKLWVIGGQTDYDQDENDVWYTTDGANWTKATQNAQWSTRSGHTTVVYNGKIWILGGTDHYTTENDVWYSTDGASWTQATGNAAWSARTEHTTLVYDGKIWIAGGYNGFYYSRYRNDIWYSTDGTTWQQATTDAQWGSRHGHTSALFKNQPWILGGYSYFDSNESKNDVWYYNE